MLLLLPCYRHQLNRSFTRPFNFNKFINIPLVNLRSNEKLELFSMTTSDRYPKQCQHHHKTEIVYALLEVNHA